MTATVGGLVWSKDPEALRKINEQRLRDLGVPDAAAKRLFRNSARDAHLGDAPHRGAVGGEGAGLCQAT